MIKDTEHGMDILVISFMIFFASHSSEWLQPNSHKSSALFETSHHTLVLRKRSLRVTSRIFVLLPIID
jgi:hypothetical protein